MLQYYKVRFTKGIEKNNISSLSYDYLDLGQGSLTMDSCNGEKLPGDKVSLRMSNGRPQAIGRQRNMNYELLWKNTTNNNNILLLLKLCQKINRRIKYIASNISLTTFFVVIQVCNETFKTLMTIFLF